jgi:hypothetical protein
MLQHHLDTIQKKHDHNEPTNTDHHHGSSIGGMTMLPLKLRHRWSQPQQAVSTADDDDDDDNGHPKGRHRSERNTIGPHSPSSPLPQVVRRYNVQYYYQKILVALGLALVGMTMVLSFWTAAAPSVVMESSPKCIPTSSRSNLTSWISTPLYDRRFFPTYQQFSDFLDGPATAWNSTDESSMHTTTRPTEVGICELRTNILYWHHFPHTYVHTSNQRECVFLFHLGVYLHSTHSLTHSHTHTPLS